MIKNSVLTIALLSSLSLHAEDTKMQPEIETVPVQTSTHNGLLGATHIKAYVGTTKYGDDEIDDLYDSSIQYGIKGQFKISDNISLGGGVEMLTADLDDGSYTADVSGTMLYLEGLYHFLPNDIIDPFISLGLAYVSYDFDMEYYGETFSESDSDNGYKFTTGAEFDLTNKIFLTPAFSYYKIGDGDASKDISLDIDFAVTRNFYLGSSINVELEDTNISYYVNLGFKF